MATSQSTASAATAPQPAQIELKRIQAKLNRLVKNSLLHGPLIPELGILDAPTTQAMQRFSETYAIHSSKSFMPFIHLKRQSNGKPSGLALPLQSARPCLPLPQHNFGLAEKIPTYDPLPDLLPWSHALRVLQWLTDHSPGALSEMTKQSLCELAHHMIPRAKRATILANTPPIVDALVDGQKSFGADLDSTGWFLMAIATAFAETGSFAPTSEGVDYKSAYNNSAYEDFDVYEPYYVYAPDKATALIEASREKAKKAAGPAFQEPTRNPEKNRGASNGNSQSGDGARFRGRGFVQLTHRSEYEAATKDLGIDLLSNPDVLNTDVSVSAQVLTWYFANKSVIGIHALQTAVKNEDTIRMRESVNGIPKKGLPAGMNHFNESYSRGKRFLEQARTLKHLRAGLASW